MAGCRWPLLSRVMAGLVPATHDSRTLNKQRRGQGLSSLPGDKKRRIPTRFGSLCGAIFRVLPGLIGHGPGQEDVGGGVRCPSLDAEATVGRGDLLGRARRAAEGRRLPPNNASVSQPPPSRQQSGTAPSVQPGGYLSWLSLLPLRLNPIITGRRSRADWHWMQVLTPGRTRRRARGISSPHASQWVSLSPVGMRARALRTPSMTVSSI